ncbi:MAG: hypothetical protein PHW63_02430 [Alphaproteobacteria bacterium]|nr:hypothetical protein [Alphaproteobacteria bacterium]
MPLHSSYWFLGQTFPPPRSPRSKLAYGSNLKAGGDAGLRRASARRVASKPSQKVQGQ